MLKKLHIKMILINTVLMVTVLAAILLATYLSSVRDYEQSSTRVLETIMSQATGVDRPKKQLDNLERRKGVYVPYYYPQGFSIVLFLDATNHVIDVVLEGNPPPHLTDFDMLADVIISQSSEYGFLKNEQIRYYVVKEDDTVSIACVDTVVETTLLSMMRREYAYTMLYGLVISLLLSAMFSFWAIKPVKKSWRQQQQFLETVSHELKTPIASILANLSVLSESEGEPSEKAWVDSANAEAKRMSKLVDQLLFLSISDYEQSQHEHKEFDLSKSIWSCVLAYESLAFEAGKIIAADIEDGICYIGVPDQIYQLAVILLDNAIKYSEKDSTIRLVLKKEAERIYLSVINQGSVIPKEQLNKLFDRFYRTDSQRAKQVKGFGLGLSIAKQIIDNHNGAIRATSDMETGTAFEVCLPCGARTRLF